MFEDSHGNIWFQRADGMGVYVAARDTILNFEYKKNNANSFPSVVSFAEDRKGRVWATGGAGELGYALSKSPEKGLVYKLNDGHT